jgi:hypothetical protein
MTVLSAACPELLLFRRIWVRGSRNQFLKAAIFLTRNFIYRIMLYSGMVISSLNM